MSLDQRSTDQATAGSRGPKGMLRAAICALDALIRRIRGVQEFTDDPYCLLRIGRAKSGSDVTLSDGTHVGKGETVGELHIWNEHIPAMPVNGTLVAWLLRMYSSTLRSFRLLARYLASEAQWSSLRAWCGKSSFTPAGVRAPDLFPRLGFEVVGLQSPPKFRNFWDNVYWWMLNWTFNPTSLGQKRFFNLERWEVWISSAELQRRYGGPGTERTDTPI